MKVLSRESLIWSLSYFLTKKGCMSVEYRSYKIDGIDMGSVNINLSWVNEIRLIKYKLYATFDYVLS